MRNSSNPRPNLRSIGASSVSALGLREDDFRRLGLGGAEARVSVIRRAVSDAAAPLVGNSSAKRGGTSTARERELAEVVTSAYRLLDPRRRSTLIERVQLVRAEPAPVRGSLWASGSEKTRPAEQAKKLAAPPDSDEMDWMLDMLSELRTTPPARGGAAARASASKRGLSEVLFGSRETRLSNGIDRAVESVRKLRRQAWLPWGVSAAATCLVLLILLGVTGTGLRDEAARARGAVQLTLPDAGNSSATEQTEAALNADRGSRETPIAGEGGQLLPLVPSSEPANGPERDSGPVRDLELDAAPNGNGGAVEMAGGGLSPALGDAEVHDSMANADNSMANADNAGQWSEIFGGFGETASADVDGGRDVDGQRPGETQEPAVDSMPLESIVDVAEGVIKEVRAPVALPSEDALSRARAEVRLVLASRGATASLGPAFGAELWRSAVESEEGSAERLAWGSAAAVQLVLHGKLAEAWGIIERQTTEFDWPVAEAAMVVLRDVQAAAVVVNEQQQVCQWGLRTSEAGLQSEAYRLAAEAARLATRAAVDADDEALRDRCKQKRDAITAAERFAESVSEQLRIGVVELAEPGEAGLVGRQLCLNLRRWEAGLPWLAVAEIARLSKCAQDELVFMNQPSSRALIANGRQWLEAAETQRSGRMADSMRLRGYTLLVKAAAESRGVEQLELQAELRELAEVLPEDLLPLDLQAAELWLAMAAGNGAIQAGTSAAGSVAPEGNEDGGDVAGAVSGSLGMVASVQVRGEAKSIGLRFTPRLRLSRSALDQVLDVVGLPRGPLKFDAHGFLRLEEATSVEIVLRGPELVPSGMVLRDDNWLGEGMRLQIADHAVPLEAISPLDREAFVARLDLPAGLYRVHWTVFGDQFPPCQLTLRNAVDQQTIPLRHDVVSRREARRVPIDQWVTLRARGGE